MTIGARLRAAAPACVEGRLLRLRRGPEGVDERWALRHAIGLPGPVRSIRA